jgi:hypothetical protein
MKRLLIVLAFGILSISTLMAGSTMAAPLDVSAFAVFPDPLGDSSSIIVSGNSFTLKENAIDTAIFLFSDSFVVGNNATILSFDFSLNLGPTDIDDFLSFNLNQSLTPTILTAAGPTGHFQIDLTQFRNTTISLEWGLVEGGDNELGATGSISNIDLASSPVRVPEPSILILITVGIAGLAGLRRKIHSAAEEVTVKKVA